MIKGQCRYNPPVSNGELNAWPLVKGDACCGKFGWALLIKDYTDKITCCRFCAFFKADE